MRKNIEKLLKKYSIKKKYIYYSLVFILFFLVIFSFFYKNTLIESPIKDSIAKGKVSEQTVSSIKNLAEERINEVEEKMIKNKNIKSVKIKLKKNKKENNNIIDNTDIKLKEKLVDLPKNSKSQNFGEKGEEEIITNKINNIKENYGKIILLDFMNKIKDINNNSDNYKIKYNPISVKKYKDILIESLVYSQLNEKKDNYISLDNYLEKRNIKFISYLKEINNKVSDLKGTDLFYIKINFKKINLKNKLLLKEYNNIIGISLTEIEMKSFNNFIEKELEKVKQNLEKKLNNDKNNNIFIEEDISALTEDVIKNNLIKNILSLFGNKHFDNLRLDIPYRKYLSYSLMYISYLTEIYYQEYENIINKKDFSKELILEILKTLKVGKELETDLKLLTN